MFKDKITESKTNNNLQAPGFFRRLAAICYDSFLLVAVFFLVTSMLLPVNSGKAFAPNQYYYPVILFVVGYLFFAWFWTHGGQTLGMRAWKLKLTTENDQPISWQIAACRYFAACLSLLSLGLGFCWIIIDTDKKAWHDYLSKTKLTCL